MAISCFEKFTGNDWVRYAYFANLAAAAGCFFFSIISMIFNYPVGQGIYVLVVGLLILLLSGGCSCIGACLKAREFVVEKMFCGHPAFVGAIYILLSIYCFIVISPCIGAGMLILVAALTEFCAECNVIADKSSAKKPSTASNSV